MRRQFVNDPRSIVAEALEGLELSHPQLVRWNREPSFVARARPGSQPKVALVAGGGSGHEPLHTGYVGVGMLDAAVPGGIFASPTADQIDAATSAVDRGQGVVHIIKNYTGDVINFGIAAELAEAGGRRIGRVLVDDDLATDGLPGPGRRGTAAVVVVEKVCGAAAERGASLEQLVALGERVAGSARTMALALEACTHPGESRPSFDLEPHEVELGVGIHGERGIGRAPFGPASELAALLVRPVLEALELRRGDSVIALVNGLGSTHPLELSVMFRETCRLLTGDGIAVVRSLVGPSVTALDMAGCSITLVRADDELVALWDDPVRTPGLSW